MNIETIRSGQFILSNDEDIHIVVLSRVTN